MTQLVSLPLLDAVRPDPGWRTDRALLSAYSAHPGVLAALLLALHGRDDDWGSGDLVPLAQAVTSLRGKVRFVLQRGRIARARRKHRVAAVFDQFIHEVPWDEAAKTDMGGKSWHAKLAIVRHVDMQDPKAAARWRFWLGSRNFTKDDSYDIGLSLTTVEDEPGEKLPDVAEVARRLAKEAGCESDWGTLVDEIRNERWRVPGGIRVEEITLMLPGDEGRSLPTPKPELSWALAVSPFLDGGTVSAFAKWPSKKRTLLSTRMALLQLALQKRHPLEGLQLLARPEAPEEGGSPYDDDDEQEEGVEKDEEGGEKDGRDRGLHAKFIWVKHGGSATFWMGSPNLTRRGWTGNAEAYARIFVDFRGSGEAALGLEDGIKTFADATDIVRLQDLATRTAKLEQPDPLEVARNQVSARLNGYQTAGDTACVLTVQGTPPHPDNPSVILKVSRIGEEFAEWPRGDRVMRLPKGPSSVESGLLLFSVSLRGKRSLCWTQLLEHKPALPASRDMALFHKVLGLRGMLTWMGSTLSGTTGEGGGRWDANPPDTSRRDKQLRGAVTGFPTVEQALRAWRDPARLKQFDEMLTAALKEATNSKEEDREPLDYLKAFAESWTTLRENLIEGGHGDDKA